MAFDFDEIVDRRGTGSYKWDSASSPEVLPLWVADMDFRTAPAVTEAIVQRALHGVFGYVKVPDEYYEALIHWFSHRHGWLIDRDSVIYTSGVVPAVSAIIKALVRPGDGVIVQTPAYNCFFSSIRNNGCRIVDNPLLRTDTPSGFTYGFDYEDLENKAADPSNTLMLLCNPHNPSGRIWSREELMRVADICHRHGVRVVSDEIHCELTAPGLSYTPYAVVDADAVVCCSPSKAFNIAGLQIANIVCPSLSVREAVDKAININEVCDVNPFGVTALVAAYNRGAEWLDALRAYLYGNYEALRLFFASRMPRLRVADLEATYLAWIDITPLGIGSDRLEELMLERGNVWVNAGSMYGQDGYMRINMACPRARLMEGLERFYSVIRSL